MTRLLRPLRRLSSVLALAALAALAPLPAAAEGDSLAFTFDQVDVRLFSQVVGSFTGRKIVVGEDVEGKITVVSPEVSKDEAYALFAAVLESSGFTIVPEHGVDRVVKAPERPAGLGLGPVVSDGRPLPEHGLVTRVLAVEHVSAAEMRDLLEAQTQRKGAFAVLQETNHLVFTDTADAVRRVESLVKQLDKPGMARVTEVIEVEHADAGDLARELAASFAESQSRAQQLLGRLPASTPGAVLPAFTPPTIIPVEHANRLLVTGSGRQIQRVKELLAQLDVEAPAARAPLRPILLNYLRAEDLARNITTLLEKYAASNPDPAHARRIAVEASPLAGALLVAASSAEEFRAVEDLVRVLDVRPRQVHISVVIAEVQEGDSETLGFQFNAAGTYHGNAFGGGSHPNAETAAGSTLASVVGSQMFPEGLTAGIVNKAGTTIGAFNLDAIRQNAGVRILAHPSISAENNVAAQVSIVDNIPMTESTVTGTGSDKDVVQTITRYDVGVKLSLTPHITPDGRVQMELEPSIDLQAHGEDRADRAHGRDDRHRGPHALGQDHGPPPRADPRLDPAPRLALPLGLRGDAPDEHPHLRDADRRRGRRRGALDPRGRRGLHRPLRRVHPRGARREPARRGPRRAPRGERGRLPPPRRRGGGSLPRGINRAAATRNHDTASTFVYGAKAGDAE